MVVLSPIRIRFQGHIDKLLAALSRRERDHLWSHLEPVSLRFEGILYEPDEPIRHVYFPPILPVAKSQRKKVSGPFFASQGQLLVSMKSHGTSLTNRSGRIPLSCA